MTSAQILKCGGLYLVNEIGWSISFKCEYCAEVMHKLGTFLSHILNHLIEIQDAKVSKLINGVLNNERRNNEEERLVSEMSAAELTHNSKAATETNEKVIKTECGDSEKSLQTPFEELSIEFIQQNTSTSYDLNIFKDVSSETLQNDENVLHEQIINEMQLHSVENIHAAEKFEIEIFFGGTTEKNSLTGNDTEMGHIYSDDNTTNDSIIPSNKTKQKRKIKSNTPAKNVSKKHSSNEPLKCVHCNKRFLKQRTLKRHLVIHSAQKPYVCDYCNATFADRGNYNVHRRRHLGILPHTCQICNKGFTTTTDLNTHLLSHSDSRPFICDICGATYKSKQQVERHIHRLHSNIRNYSCDVCEKKFFDGKTLSDHYLSHTDERPFECEICKNKFSRKKALVEHIKLHSDIYEYSCPYCDKAFQQRPGLHSHIRNVHRK